VKTLEVERNGRVNSHLTRVERIEANPRFKKQRAESTLVGRYALRVQTRGGWGKQYDQTMGRNALDHLMRRSTPISADDPKRHKWKKESGVL